MIVKIIAIFKLQKHQFLRVNKDFCFAGLQIRLNICRATEDVVQEFVKTEFVVFLMARLLTLWKKYWECTFKVELWQHEAVVKVL